MTTLYCDTDNKRIFIVPYCCGSSFMNRQGFVWGTDVEKDEYTGKFDATEWKTITVLRDPLERFNSWYCRFAHQGSDAGFPKSFKPHNWNSVNEWADDFRNRLHYDPHTALQKYLVDGSMIDNKIPSVWFKQHANKQLSIDNFGVRYFTTTVYLSSLFNMPPIAPFNSMNSRAEFTIAHQSLLKDIYREDYAFIEDLDFIKSFDDIQ